MTKNAFYTIVLSEKIIEFIFLTNIFNNDRIKFKYGDILFLINLLNEAI